MSDGNLRSLFQKNLNKNKYKRWHDEIIKRAKKRETIESYFEKHHIKPKCLGGSNEKCNIVKLTYREHFLVHWLLTKFTKGSAKAKMIHCLAMMSCRVKGRGHIISGWQYALIRKASVDSAIGKIFSAKRKQNISDSLKGRKASSETKDKISIASIGNKNALGMRHTEETKALISKALKEKYAGKPGPGFGRKHSVEAIAKIKKSMNDFYNFGNLREQRREQAKIRYRGPNGRWA